MKEEPKDSTALYTEAIDKLEQMSVRLNMINIPDIGGITDKIKDVTSRKAEVERKLAEAGEILSSKIKKAKKDG
jgi:tetrahydromethanopterin S-methyltransferase subunit A